MVVLRHRSRRSRFAVPSCAAMLLGAVLSIAPPVPARAAREEPAIAPQITFQETGVTVTGATADGRVVVFTVGRDRQGYMPRVFRLDDLPLADADGVARVELDEPVMRRSVWAAVDLATGEYVLAAPEGFELRRVDLPAEGLGASRRFLDREGRFLDALLVRPAAGPEGEEGAGFWGIAFGDGGTLDQDGRADGRVTLDVTLMEPLGESPPVPRRLRPKDVLIGVDSTTLEIFATRLADGPDDGGGNDGNGGGEG